MERLILHGNLVGKNVDPDREVVHTGEETEQPLRDDSLASYRCSALFSSTPQHSIANTHTHSNTHTTPTLFVALNHIGDTPGQKAFPQPLFVLSDPAGLKKNRSGKDGKRIERR